MRRILKEPFMIFWILKKMVQPEYEMIRRHLQHSHRTHSHGPYSRCSDSPHMLICRSRNISPTPKISPSTDFEGNFEISPGLIFGETRYIDIYLYIGHTIYSIKLHGLSDDSSLSNNYFGFVCPLGIQVNDGCKMG